MKVPEKYRIRNHHLHHLNVATGNDGFFVIPHYRINGYEIRCQSSDGLGWEHVSVTIAPVKKKATRCPTWEEMCWVKDQFWDETEVVVQYHPAKSDHVSMHHFCLHLWRPMLGLLPTPDPLMVGIDLKQ